jgi:DNA-binding response OmpR family regulator/HPt (histidine-containing phosphotransfer) domain-containing protein
MKRVLIIEDDPIIASIYRNKFQSEGFQVLLAADGESGLQSIITNNPDVVLLDLMLPKMHGVAVLKTIRSKPQFANTPIVVFTNAYAGNAMEEAWQAGATNVLTKANHTPRQVMDIVKAALQSAASVAPAPAPAPPPAAVPTAPQMPMMQPGPFLQMPSQMPAPVPMQMPMPMPAAMQGMLQSAGMAGNEAAFQAELLRYFVATAPETMLEIRRLYMAFTKATGQPQISALTDLYRRVHSVTGNAAITGLGILSQMSSIIEALLKDLYEKPQNITQSTIRTIAQGVDFLADLFKDASRPSTYTPPQSNILVVDDEIISRRAVCFALDRAGLRSMAIDDPLVALKMLDANPVDLIILDVIMPGMDGFSLCSRIRAMPEHKHTPVIFVTSLTDFGNRAKSTLSGGNDLIAKPFLFAELAVKVLVFLHRSRLPK